MEQLIIDETGKLALPVEVLQRWGWQPGEAIQLVEMADGLKLFRSHPGESQANENGAAEMPFLAFIVETPRGPTLAGTRITVYSVMDLIKAGRDKGYIEQMMLLRPEQVQAVFDYVEKHREAVEAEYERILQREAERRAEAEKVFRERSPFPPDMPWEEKRQLMMQKLEAQRKATQEQHGNHATAG